MDIAYLLLTVDGLTAQEYAKLVFF